jgi:hypothetical protein
MKLLELISCDIYRDGGSLEATWKTDNKKDWTIFLKVDLWKQPIKVKTYRLFNCNVKELADHQQITKGSAEHLQLMKLAEDWESEGHKGLDALGKTTTGLFSFEHLMNELKKGNY